jgi:hypothetical protein
MMIAPAFVIFIIAIAGLAFFYDKLVQRKNVIAAEMNILWFIHKNSLPGLTSCCLTIPDSENKPKK